MLVMKAIGGAILLVGIVVAVLGVTGATAALPAIPIGAMLALLGTILFVTASKITSGFERDVRRVRELATLGVRRTGKVVEVAQYVGHGGGTVTGAEGTLMVLVVELRHAAGFPETVRCLLVENSERARARLGSHVTILEHPEDSDLRALEGHLPNGRRADA